MRAGLLGQIVKYGKFAVVYIARGRKKNTYWHKILYKETFKHVKLAKL